MLGKPLATLSAFTLSIFVLSGCSESALQPTQATSNPSAMIPTRPSPAGEAKTVTEKQPVKPVGELKAARFEPPYMDRVELFLPPSRKHVGRKASSNHKVVLRGFVNVDNPRALLLVDGKMVTLAAGEQRGDLEVIQIDRPIVTLQRGRVRWTESLYPEI